MRSADIFVKSLGSKHRCILPSAFVAVRIMFTQSVGHSIGRIMPYETNLSSSILTFGFTVSDTRRGA